MSICLLDGIAVDAAHSTKNKVTEIQGVDLKTGKIVFYQNLGNQTTNIGEFLAIVEGVKYIIANDYTPKIIYSDSLTAISWFQAKRTASQKRNKHLQKAEIYLKVAAYLVDQIQVVKWDTKRNGENPADFGNKGKRNESNLHNGNLSIVKYAVLFEVLAQGESQPK